MPGVSPETLDVSIERRRLTISGQSKQDVPDPASQLLHEGLGEGHFEQVFDLTEDADPEAIRASIKFGLVTILIPRKTDQLPRRIAVEH
jgi:HSP20 family protein